jgi:hypothetical protein
MSVIGNIALVAAMVSTTAAFAGTSHLTDSEYLAAARCQGLFSAPALGAADASGINKLMKSEGSYRTPEVADRADEARTDAKRQARDGSAASRSALVSERDGSCQVWARSGVPSPQASN